MKKLILIFIIGLMSGLFSGNAEAQKVTISGELRPRYEYRHGYRDLMNEGADPANFVSQRTRLNLKYSGELFSVGFSLQDVRVWGDVSQLNKSDVNGTSIHEAWGEMKLYQNIYLKVGRQEISYDDQRIFGAVNWAQQARSHDAAIVKYSSGKHKVHFGVALNAIKESHYKVEYDLKNYKALQYLWYHGDFNKFGVSFLFLNNGLEYTDNSDTANVKQKVAYSQTVGPRISYKGGKLKANAAFYYQGGKNKANRSLSALYFAADASYAINMFSVGAGFEYLSGTQSDEIGVADKTDKSFTPFYGTNHKFNGWMDYFYVGNYSGQTGLVDISVPVKFKKNKFSAMLITHYFMTAATVKGVDSEGKPKDFSSGLGTEIDFAIGYAVSKTLAFKAGYSQMFATETMEMVKNGSKSETSNWGWMMLIFKPNFFTSK